MSGYQTIEALRPILSYGPPKTPVVAFERVREFSERDRLVMRAVAMRRDERLSQYEIARQLGVNRAFVQRVTRHVEPPPEGWSNGGKTTKYSASKAQRMKRAGFTYQEIAEDLGCSQSNAWRLVNGEWQRDRSGIVRPTRKVEMMVERATGVPLDRLRRGHGSPGNHRGEGQTKARAILYWLCRRELSGLSLPKIGKYLGGYNHTSILFGIRRVDFVIRALHLAVSPCPGDAARQLWAAEWPKPAGQR